MTSLDTVVATSMRIAVDRDELVQKLSVVGRGLSSRTTVQVLTGILLDAEEGRLSLAATDMEVSLRVGLEARVEGEGKTVVPGRLIVEIARLLPGGEVMIQRQGETGTLEVRAGTVSYQLTTYSAEDFPRLPEIDRAALFQVEREAFLETVSCVGRSASRDESRPVLTGILVRLEDSKLVMAATDSYRLSVKETVLSRAPGQELEAIVPARALAELQRIGQAATAETIEVGVQENQVVFGTDGVWMTARRIDGQFPNYRQLLPENFEAEVSLPRQELTDVVRRAKVMVERNSPVRLKFEEGQLTVSAQTPDRGEVRETVPVGYTGDLLEIGFNAEFLLDGIESVSGETVRLRLISPLRPGMIMGESNDFLYLIMPIRLAG
jgi:DNA polymerase-3 subunit beta